MQAKLEQRTFLLTLLGVSLCFIWLLTPFFSAIFWASLLTIIFYPLQRRLSARFPGRDNSVSLAVLLVGIVVVILPVMFFGASLVQEGAAIYQKLNSGEIDLAAYVDRLREAFPAAKALLTRFDIELGNLKQQLADGAVTVSRFAAKQAVSIGQNTFQFAMSFVLMLYLTFFLLRDGDRLIELLIRALPLGDTRERLLFAKFAEVARATVKGNLVVALVQGSLGGLIFWILGIEGAIFWGAVMAIASLFPAVGAALIWAPVAVFLLFTGEVWRGVVLVAFGAGVIGLVDNLLRPILVGRDTKLPDYLVLLSTLGGLALFGLNGFVIGPLIAALFVAFWDIFIREFNSPVPLELAGDIEEPEPEQVPVDEPVAIENSREE